MRRGVSTRDIIVRVLGWLVINVGGDMVRMAFTILLLYHTLLNLTTPDHILWYGLHGPAHSQAPTTYSTVHCTQIADHTAISLVFCQLTINTKPDFRKSVGLPNSILHRRLHISCTFLNAWSTLEVPLIVICWLNIFLPAMQCHFLPTELQLLQHSQIHKYRYTNTQIQI